MHDDDGIVTITARDIYLELRTLSQEVQRIGQAVDSTARRLDDHEQRIRGVERWRYIVSVTAITSAASVIAALVEITRK